MHFINVYERMLIVRKELQLCYVKQQDIYAKVLTANLMEKYEEKSN